MASHQRGAARAAGDSGNDREYTVYKCKRAVEQNQRQQCQAGPGKGEQAEDDRRNAAQQQQPPVLRQCVDHGRPKANSGLSISLYRAHGQLLMNGWKALPSVIRNRPNANLPSGQSPMLRPSVRSAPRGRAQSKHSGIPVSCPERAFRNPSHVCILRVPPFAGRPALNALNATPGHEGAVLTCNQGKKQ